MKSDGHEPAPDAPSGPPTASARLRPPLDGGPPTVEMVLDLDRAPDAEPTGRDPREIDLRGLSPAAVERAGLSPAAVELGGAQRPRRATDTDHLGPPIGRHRASGRQHHWLAIAMVCAAVAAITLAVFGGWGRRVPAPDTVAPTGVPTLSDSDPVVVPGPTSGGPTPTGTAGATPTHRSTPSPTASAVATATAAPTTHPTPKPTPSPTPAPTPTGPTVLPIPPHTVTVFAASGQCLDDNAQIQADGNRVQSWECNNSDAQHWTFGADGTMRYHALCLRPAGTTVVSGALVQIRTCNGADQVWQFRSDKSIYNPSAGLCLTDPGLDPHNQLTLSNCNGSGGQHWTVV